MIGVALYLSDVCEGIDFIAGIFYFELLHFGLAMELFCRQMKVLSDRF